MLGLVKNATQPKGLETSELSKLSSFAPAVPSILRRNPRVLHDLRKLRDISPKPRVEFLRRAADLFVAAGLEPLDQVGRPQRLGGLALDGQQDLARRARRHKQSLPARGLE